MAILTNPLKQTSREKSFEDYEKELTNNASISYNDFNDFYQKNKIYFNENTNKIIDEIQDKFQQAFWDYNQYNFYKAHGVDEKEYIIEREKK